MLLFQKELPLSQKCFEKNVSIGYKKLMSFFVSKYRTIPIVH
jgi:hypothetical protein